jgi:hypothetical protein
VSVTRSTVEDSADHGIYVVDSSYINIDYCTVINSEDSCITVNTSPYSRVTNSYIEDSIGSHISYNSQYGIVSNNIIIAGVASTFGYGITFGHNTEAYSASYSTATGNVIKGHKHAGINMAGDSTTDISVSGNIIYGDGATGIGVNAHAENATISGNSISNCYYGIDLYLNNIRHGITASGNNISNSQRSGIRVNTFRSTIVGNTVLNSGLSGLEPYGIYITASTYGCAVIGNKCSDNQTPKTQTYGIYAAATGLTNIIIGNVVIDNATYGIYAEVGNIVRDNITDNTAIINTTIPRMDNSETPSVLNHETWLTGGTTTITNFIDGFAGKKITIIAEHSLTITDGTNIFLNGSSNFAMQATDTLTLIQKADNKWYEIARSDN